MQHPKEVDARVRSYVETRSINQQKPKTTIKMKDAKKYETIYRMTCQTGCRSSERIWSMKVLQQSLGETQSKEVKTLPSHLMNFQCSREQKWNRVRGKHSINTHFPKNPNCDTCLKTKITRAFCRRRAGTVVPQRNILVT